MELVKKHIFWQAAGWSAFAGLKSMSGPALLAMDGKVVGNLRRLSRNLTDSTSTPADQFPRKQSTLDKVLGSPLLPATLGAMAAGEMIVDKLPFIPKRTALPPLTVRALSGALIGASLYSAEDLPPLEGAVVGCTSAVLAAYVSTTVREMLTKGLHIPDFLVALAEDTLILSNGMKLIREQLEAKESDAYVGDNVDADSLV